MTWSLIIAAHLLIVQYAFAAATGLFYDFLDELLRLGQAPSDSKMVSNWDSFYARRLFSRIGDCWGRVVCSCPGNRILVRDMRNNGRLCNVVNLGSYNYLGFGNSTSPSIKTVVDSMRNFGVHPCSLRFDLGFTTIALQLEKSVAAFVGKPASLCFAQGFGTNLTALSAMFNSHDLILSDALNHSSIICGARLSGATRLTFSHGDMCELERILRLNILQRKFKRIIVVVEGIYSMEGDILDLPALILLKQKYQFYIYLDEAHSIGSLGKRGRGICDYYGVSPSLVDVMMGTFTKFAGSIGGYICGSQQLIDFLKLSCGGIVYSSFSPPAATQIVEALKELDSSSGLARIQRLRENTHFFRRSLEKMGLSVMGSFDSPVVPVLMGTPSRMAYFSREALRRGIGVVVVGFPATPILSPRSRFCISASHTTGDLEFALEVIEEIAEFCHLKFQKRCCG